MAKDLQSIFEAITPSNIQDLDIIKDAMAIFIETIETLSSESVDIKNIYNNDNIRQELIKIYLNDFYTVLSDIQNNKKLIEKIEKANEIYGDNYFDTNVIYNLSKYIKDEHFLCMRSFKESKGTEKSIKYMHELINVFINAAESNSAEFKLTKYGEFQFKISGSMDAVFYNNIVRPLAHPMGFVYEYIKLLTSEFIDYYAKKNLVYYVTDLYVVSLSVDNVTTKYYFDDNTIVDIVETVVSLESFKYYYFTDGTYLKSITDENSQTNVYLMNADDTIQTTYPGQSSVYIEYTIGFETTVIDEFEITSEYTGDIDYWARLDNRNFGGFYIGINDLSAYYYNPDEIGEFWIENDWLAEKNKGYNSTRDRNGNKLFDNEIDIPVTIGDNGLFIGDDGLFIGDDGLFIEDDGLFIGDNELFIGDNYNYIDMYNGRLEHYFSPSRLSDLKLLAGKFEKNVDVYNEGEFIEVQKIKYTDTINSSNASVDWTITPDEYYKQNKGNSEYSAQEHYIQDYHYNIATSTLIEPIFNGSTNYIDYNNEDRGNVSDPWATINENVYIGTGYADNNTGMFINNMSPEIGDQSIVYLETVVSGDAVNLQYETKDTLESGIWKLLYILETNELPNDVMINDDIYIGDEYYKVKDDNYSTWFV